MPHELPEPDADRLLTTDFLTGTSAATIGASSGEVATHRSSPNPWKEIRHSQVQPPEVRSQEHAGDL